jgi:hypothetical protein
MVAALALCGCSTGGTSSEDVPTPAIEGTLGVTQWSSGGIVVEAQLRQAANNNSGYVTLTGDDLLIASVGQPLASVGDIKGDLFGGLDDLSRQYRRMSGGNGDSWWLDFDLVAPYRASFDGVTVGQTVYVGLYRSDMDDAPYSYAIIPAEFDIATPAADQAFSRAGDAITITWTPVDATADTKITAEQRCPDGGFSSWSETQTPDSGGATIPAATFSGSGTCTLTLLVDRYIPGVVDSHFHDGQFFAHQKRRVVVATDP